MGKPYTSIKRQRTMTAYTCSHVMLSVFCKLIVHNVGGTCAWQWRQGSCLRASLGSCVWQGRQGSCLRASLGPCVGDADAVH